MNLSVAYNDFAISLQHAGHRDHAEQNYRKAIELDETNGPAWSNLGTILSGKALHTEALAAYEKAIELDPNMAPAHSNISVIYADRGQNEKALASLRKALELQPDFPVAHSNLISQLDLSADQTTEALQAERKEWARRHTGKIPRMPKVKHRNNKIRVGYVSADMRQHSASYLFGMMLTEFDRDAFDVYAYYSYPIYDGVTDIFEKGVTKWRDVRAMTDEELAGQIRHDKIDILVDLSGHSAGNRLLAFARKPAPVQITAWGYIGGTGLREMDYMLADEVLVPMEERHLYAEKIIDLPCGINLGFREPFPAITPRPDRPFTFGSFNRLPKFTKPMFDAWGKIFEACPDAQLLMKTGELDDEGTRDYIIAELKAVGIDQLRVQMMGRSKWAQHVEAFNLVDVCLDSFPHGGGVTTMETLMMGVPVVSLMHPTIFGRVSADSIKAVGMDEWIGQSLDDYVQIAIDAYNEREHITAGREALRKKMENSVLCNTKECVEAVENVYRFLVDTSPPTLKK